MARSLKTRGMAEIRMFKRRVIRQHGLERIGKDDRDWLVAKVGEIEARIVKMRETQDNEEGEL